MGQVVILPCYPEKGMNRERSDMRRENRRLKAERGAEVYLYLPKYGGKFSQVEFVTPHCYCPCSREEMYNFRPWSVQQLNS
jgi:hypothetical protein